MLSDCGLAVGSCLYSCSQTRAVIHRSFDQAVSCAKNVFFSQVYARFIMVSIHMVYVHFQSVIVRLCTVYTGLTKTTTNKLYVYKGVCS
jgi:hypothetical protein